MKNFPLLLIAGLTFTMTAFARGPSVSTTIEDRFPRLESQFEGLERQTTGSSLRVKYKEGRAEIICPAGAKGCNDKRDTRIVLQLSEVDAAHSKIELMPESVIAGETVKASTKECSKPEGCFTFQVLAGDYVEGFDIAINLRRGDDHPRARVIYHAPKAGAKQVIFHSASSDGDGDYLDADFSLH